MEREETGMNRRVFAPCLGAFLFALCTTTEAQQPAIAKVGWILVRGGSRSPLEGYVKELRALGWIEGKNIVFEFRDPKGNIDRVPALIDELVRLKVDVIIMASTNFVLAAKKVTKTVPIVFGNVSDP